MRPRTREDWQGRWQYQSELLQSLGEHVTKGRQEKDQVISFKNPMTWEDFGNRPGFPKVFAQQNKEANVACEFILYKLKKKSWKNFGHSTEQREVVSTNHLEGKKVKKTTKETIPLPNMLQSAQDWPRLHRPPRTLVELLNKAKPEFVQAAITWDVKAVIRASQRHRRQSPTSSRTVRYLISTQRTPKVQYGTTESRKVEWNKWEGFNAIRGEEPEHLLDEGHGPLCTPRIDADEDRWTCEEASCKISA